MNRVITSHGAAPINARVYADRLLEADGRAARFEYVDGPAEGTPGYALIEEYAQEVLVFYDASTRTWQTPDVRFGRLRPTAAVLHTRRAAPDDL